MRALNSVAVAYHHVGRYTEELAAYDQAITLSERLYGAHADHARIMRSNRALLLVYLDPAQAKDAAEAVVASAPPPGDDVPSITGRSTAALAHLELGDVPGALQLADEALAMGHRVGKERDPDYGFVLQTAVEVYARTGRTAQAAAEADRMLALEHQVVPDSPLWVQFLRVAGPAYLAAGQNEKARALLERGLALSAKHPFFPSWVPELKFHLARALLATHGDRARARELLKEAHEGLAPLPARRALLAEVYAVRGKAL